MGQKRIEQQGELLQHHHKQQLVQIADHKKETSQPIRPCRLKVYTIDCLQSLINIQMSEMHLGNMMTNGERKNMLTK